MAGKKKDDGCLGPLVSSCPCILHQEQGWNHSLSGDGVFRNIHGLTEEKNLGEEKRSRRDEFIPFPRTYLIYPPKLSTQYMTYRGNMRKKRYFVYLRGMKREEWVAPIPGLPCLTGLL